MILHVWTSNVNLEVPRAKIINLILTKKSIFCIYLQIMTKLVEDEQTLVNVTY